MTIIERAAKAMEERRRELIGQPLARIWDELAKAAIEAMREPTEKMVEAGFDCVPPFGDHNPDKAWRAMIDAALQEGKSS
ncbi:hypothetical protein [Rhizobium sp. 11515TR]|uniref:hypothetical protein n=1 Tax=Rhizobium sp. 11515TR TaxID=2028343 RepID=UPI000BA88EBB|nr:hypothetical protein [Rhizobium sp. 11515TR]ASW06331.1 hypothetical protein CKA34_10835 [Rhizobium sp. 11515TR]